MYRHNLVTVLYPACFTEHVIDINWWYLAYWSL